MEEGFEPVSEGSQVELTYARTNSDAPKMRWGSSVIATSCLFVVAVQFSIYFSSLWPYMRTIDPSATQTFYGFTLAIFSFGQMTFSPLFGYWSNRLKRIRPIIAVGLCLSILGNVVYMFTEAVSIPTRRKYVIMVGRLLGGMGAGVSGPIRGYIATSATSEHKKRAIAFGSCALSLGLTAGPVLQAAVTPIGYPGYIAGPIHFNQYTAPAYISIAGALILLVLLHTVFEESTIGIDTKKEKDPYHYVPKYDRIAAFLCILCWFSLFFTITNGETVEVPYTMAVFKWSNDDAVFYNSIILSVSSVISLCLYIVFAIFGKRINERKAACAGLTMLCAFYAITYPWPFFPGMLMRHEVTTPYSNQTTQSMANSTWLSTPPVNHTTTTISPDKIAGVCAARWCDFTPQLPLAVYLAAYPLLSIGLPFCQVPCSTLLAQVLGPRPQGFVQSLMIMAGSCARMLGPILISWLFDNYGPRVAWTMTASVVSIGIFTVFIFNHRLVPLNMRPKLKSGDKLKYDGGLLYRF